MTVCSLMSRGRSVADGGSGCLPSIGAALRLGTGFAGAGMSN